MIKYYILSLLLLSVSSKTTHAQRIFNEISKYDFQVIEKHAIKNTRRQLGISKDEILYALPIFDAQLIHSFNKENISNWEFITNLRTINNKCFAYVLVYNDFLNPISNTSINGKRVYPHSKSSKKAYNLILLYYMEEKPEYFFYLVSHKMITYGECFISYKEGKTKIIYQNRNDSILTIKEVKDIEDIRSLNPATLFD